MPRKDYEERVRDREDRLRDAADRAYEKSANAAKRYESIAEHIPTGQPILVGHHSERRHRADIDRMDRALTTANEMSKRANELRNAADSVGAHGVSSDDPEAVQKLRHILASLEDTRELWKRINKAWRAAGKPAADDAKAWKCVEQSANLSAEQAADVRKRFASLAWLPNPKPFCTRNITANIRRIKARILQLESESNASHVATESHGIKYIEDPADNRVRLIFQSKPSEEIRAILKRWGLRWSPKTKSWQRMLSDAGRNAALAALESVIETMQD